MIKVIIDAEACKGCGLCVRACPKQVLRLAPTTLNSRGYHPSEVADADACIGCCSCARTCPDVVIRIEKEVE